MKRLLVIGCPGSGKSRFARALHGLTGLPLHHLDMMYWNADQSTVPRAVFMERLAKALGQEAWIIAGNYGSTLAWRLQACDTVFLLDYPMATCLAGIAARQGSARSDMPWIEQPGDEDEDFMHLIRRFHADSRPGILELLDQHADKAIHIFESRDQPDEYLAHLERQTGKET